MLKIKRYRHRLIFNIGIPYLTNYQQVICHGEHHMSNCFQRCISVLFFSSHRYVRYDMQSSLIQAFELIFRNIQYNKIISPAAVCFVDIIKIWSCWLFLSISLCKICHTVIFGGITLTLLSFRKQYINILVQSNHIIFPVLSNSLTVYHWLWIIKTTLESGYPTQHLTVLLPVAPFTNMVQLKSQHG